MLTLTINKNKISVPEGSTLLNAALKLGIFIPTMCYKDGYENFTSCMLCIVHEIKTDLLLPACSTRVQDGMEVETDTEKTKEYRKTALELLLSDHIGDCLAPCQRTCPAHMNIPLLIRQIKSNQFDEALITVKKDIALPAVLGRICSAPCEKGCNRSKHDSPVSICLLKRFVADVDLKSSKTFLPTCSEKTGKKVAIIGSGPTGLAAAYYLVQYGHSCTIFEKEDKCGGMLQYGIPADLLPKDVLKAEVEIILKLGVEFQLKTDIGKDISFEEINRKFDAVVLATGKIDSKSISGFGVEETSRGVKVDSNTYQTSNAKIFAGGNAVSEGRMAIKSAAHGKFIAVSVDQFLNGKEVTGELKKFDSRIGKLQNGEIEEFLKEAKKLPLQEPAGGLASGFSNDEAIKESERCMHCDCRKPTSCKLRLYSEKYNANQKRYKDKNRKKLERVIQHAEVIYEPGKCIKCGLCVRITQKAGEDFGLAFIGRGFDVRLDVPLNESLTNGLKKVAAECVEACPTAALAFIKGEDVSPRIKNSH
jgi:ferredoxin